jgi:hypothetical protein
MPRSSPGERGSGDGSQSLKKAGLELPALVGCDLLGTTETRNPDRDEGFSYGFGGDFRQRECLRPTGVSVDGSETVPEARRDRQRPDQVDMHMTESCRREGETPEGVLHMSRYLGSLAGCARACPCSADFPHTRPHKPLGHQLDGGVGPGMTKAVEGVKYLASERRGYEWPRLRRGCVTVKADVHPRNVHPSKPKSRTIFQDVLQLRIVILGTRKGMIIKSCRDGARSRQDVCYNTVLP